MAYALRFCLNVKNKVKCNIKSPILELDLSERQASIQVLIKLSQHKYSSKNIDRLSQGLKLKKGSKLHSLNPYLDKDKILRVSSRIKDVNVTDGDLYPIILSSRVILFPC